MGFFNAARILNAPVDGPSTPLRLEDSDLLLICRSIVKIETCLKAKLFEEGRPLLAQLLFDFQPQIVADPGLLAVVLSLLTQCEAPVLKQRLRLAADAASGGWLSRLDT